MAFFILFAALGPAPEMPRPYVWMNYAAMLHESDLVIIGVFVEERADNEPIETTLMGLEKQVEGITTTLKVGCVLKGDAKIDKVAIRHYRMRNKEQRGRFAGGIRNGPMFAEFRTQNDYMVFLKKRPDGRYRCISGYDDSAYSVKRIEPREPDEISPRTGLPDPKTGLPH